MTEPTRPPADVIEAFERELSASGRSRLERAAYRRLWVAADPAWSHSDAARSRLRFALDTLHASGMVELPTPTGRLWDTALPALPARIGIPDNRHTGRPLDPATEPWVPALEWVPKWMKTARPAQRQRIDAVHINRWLLSVLGRQPARVAREERSLHIFGDEKRLASIASGALFQSDERLTLDTLSCDAPLGGLPVARLDPRGSAHARGPVLVVENKATFDSTRLALHGRRDPGYAAIVFGSGDAASSLVDDLAHFHDLMGIRAERFDYAGDVDIAGVEAAHTFHAAAVRAGLPVTMADPLWRAVAQAAPTGDDLTADPGRTAAALVMAEQLRLPEQVAARLREGVRVPQERIDRTALADSTWWSTR